MSSGLLGLVFWSAILCLIGASQQDDNSTPCMVLTKSADAQVSGVLVEAVQNFGHCKQDRVCQKPCKPRLEVGGRVWTGGLQTALLNQGVRICLGQGFPIFSKKQLLSLEKDLPKVFIVIPESKLSDDRSKRLVQRVYDWIKTEAGFKVAQTTLIVPTVLEPDLIRAFRSRISFGLPDVAQLDDQLKNRRPFWFRWVYSQRYMVETLTEIVENLEAKTPKNLTASSEMKDATGKQIKVADPQNTIIIASSRSKSSALGALSPPLKLDILLLDDKFEDDLAFEVAIREHIRPIAYPVWYGSLGLQALDSFMVSQDEALTFVVLVKRHSVHFDDSISAAFRSVLQHLHEAPVDYMYLRLAENKTLTEHDKQLMKESGIPENTTFAEVDLNRNFRFLNFLVRVKPSINWSSETLPAVVMVRYHKLTGKFMLHVSERITYLPPSWLKKFLLDGNSKLNQMQAKCEHQMNYLSMLAVQKSISLLPYETNQMLGLNSNQLTPEVPVFAYYLPGSSIPELIARSSLIRKYGKSSSVYELQCIPKISGLPRRLIIQIQRSLGESTDTLTLQPLVSPPTG